MEHAEVGGINWQEEATEWSQRPIGWEGTSQDLMQPQLLVGGGSGDALTPENPFPAGASGRVVAGGGWVFPQQTTRWQWNPLSPSWIFGPQEPRN